MKIVVTGSSGSVGTSVVQTALSATSHHLKLLDLKPPAEKISDPRVEYQTVDLLNYDDFLAALQSADGLIHLAGYPQNRGAPPATIHNTNVSLSYNALQAAAEAGVHKVVVASSVNALGGFWSSHDPIYKYFPIDEAHPVHHSDPYSLSKYVVEVQADCIARAYPEMSICSLRFHAVIPAKKNVKDYVDRLKKDLWGYTSADSAARACLLALEVEWKGHEVLNIIADEHCADGHHAEELVKKYYPDAEIRSPMREDQSMYDSSKAERVLGWKHSGGKQPSKV